MSSPTKLRQMAKELGWPPELEKAADQLQKLKRENAALREAKDILELERCEMMRTMSLLCNQAEQLQEDKERLDWMASADYWADIAVYRTPKGLRAAIDAARKEAQP